MRMSPVEDPLDDPLPEERRLVWLPLLLLGLAWGAVVPVLALRAAFSTMTFLGERPTAADHADQHRDLGVALAVSAVLVAVGFALALWGRSAGGGWVFTLLVLPTLGLGLLWVLTLPAQPRHSDLVPDRPVACQEHSGGDTRCPGG